MVHTSDKWIYEEFNTILKEKRKTRCTMQI